MLTESAYCIRAKNHTGTSSFYATYTTITFKITLILLAVAWKGSDTIAYCVQGI